MRRSGFVLCVSAGLGLVVAGLSLFGVAPAGAAIGSLVLVSSLGLAYGLGARAPLVAVAVLAQLASAGGAALSWRRDRRQDRRHRGSRSVGAAPEAQDGEEADR